MAAAAATTTPRAAIIGLSGPELTAAELAMLRGPHRPLGVILFARNVVSPEQLRALTGAVREELGEAAPILVDQEGGRVARLRPPHWPAHPPAAVFERHDAVAAEANAALMGQACAGLGLDVVCAPVLDLRIPGQHQVIGDRAFSDDPDEVARLGGAWVRGLQQGGAIPVIKHIPGHGRALVDSHESLPRVEAGLAELAADIAPFAALAGSGAWAMTAHILYAAWDASRPATLSPRIIADIVRGAIGFEGVLISDDLSMGAMRGCSDRLAAEAIGAGCDLALHCTGVLEEGLALLAGCPALTDRAAARLAEARAARDAALRPAEPEVLVALRDRHLGATALLA